MLNIDEEAIKEKIIHNIKHVYDPEIPVNIYDLGLIYKIDFEVKDNYTHCYIDMTLTSPSCPVAESLLDQVKYVTLSVDEVDEAYVRLVFEPVWTPEMMSEDAREIMGASGAII